MRKFSLRRILSFFLALTIISGAINIINFPSNSADSSTPSVKIVSFMRGEQADLRSSELLEARVEGYDGNPQDLIYEWTNELGTYLYVYNSHNMYFINNTDGEIEVYNDNCSASANMSGRAYKDTFAGKGFAWAAIYGYNVKSNEKLSGTITVTVKDAEGNVLCSDSHTGSVRVSGSLWRPTYTYSGILPYSLETDMDDVTIGIFEGDKRNVKDLLGESAIVHITCVESSVSKGSIVSGSNRIKLTKEDGEYYITGVTAGNSTSTGGDAQVSLTIKKATCKFHYNESGTATTTVFVFKKPTTSTTTTTLTLTGNLDSRCSYYVNGVEGTKQSDGTIIFTGLTPNTDYSVEVRGKYIDENNNTKYAYAYVYDTTLPVYAATVNILLDGVLTDLDVVHDGDTHLFLREMGTNNTHEVVHTAVGTYTASVENGIFYPCHIDPDGHVHQVTDHQLIIENANASINLHHYSVKYDTDGGYFEQGDDPGSENYFTGSSVTATSSVPKKSGWVFAGWEYGSNTLLAGDTITNSITSPIVLKAKWTRSINVTVNVNINHKDNGQLDDSFIKDDVTVELLYRSDSSSPYHEAGIHVTLSDNNHNGYDYIPTWENGAEQTKENVISTQYIATVPTFTGLSEDFEYGVLATKSGYDIVSIDKRIDENGCWIIDVNLIYNPDTFDIDFSVSMDEDVPKELYPKEAIAKLVYWCPDHMEWEVISEHAGTKPGIHMHIDPETGKASATYPVWIHDAYGDPRGYRFVITAFVYADGTIVPTTDKLVNGEIHYTDNNYTGMMIPVESGKKFGTTLEGAYFDESSQSVKGTLHAIIDVEKYSVTFDAMSGTVNGLPSQTVDELYYIPEFDPYPAVNGDHAFYGWYLDPEHTIPATPGTILTEDITLYAKYGRNLTGNVKIAGNYLRDDVWVDLNHADRPDHAVVVLQEITPDGVYNIANQRVSIDWVDNIGISEDYYFYDLYQHKEYRIEILLLNYTTEYQNSQTYIDGNGDINNDYNDTDYRVIYTEDEPLLTFVNAYLHFNPISYFQEVTIDSTLIGEGFRPETALVEIVYREVNTNNDFATISQHNVYPYGIVVGMANDGFPDGTYGEYVWNEKFNGHLYDYQMALTKYNGLSPDELPIQIIYGNVSRWSPLNNAPTGVLEATIFPKNYIVKFDLDVPEDTIITGMDEFFFISVAGEYGYQTSHQWSHPTPISATPQREGYKFLGWECLVEDAYDGEKVLASVHENITLKAIWEPEFTDLTISVSGTADIDEGQSYIFDLYDDSDNLVVTVAVHGDNAVTIKDLPIGEYTVIEKDGWSWRYTPEALEKDIVLTHTQENILNFHMSRTKIYWLDGNNHKENAFGEINS